MQKLIYKVLLSYLIIVLSNATVFAEDKLVSNLSSNWLIYDAGYESFLPIKEDQLKNYTSIHQQISIEKYRQYDLKFLATKDLTVFVDNKLVYKKISIGREEIKIPLSTIVTDTKGECLITFYHPKRQLPIKESFIVYSSNIVNSDQSLDSGVNLFFVRDVKGIPDIFVVLFMVIISLIVLYKQVYPNEFSKYFVTGGVSGKNEYLQQSIISIPSMWMTLTVGLSIALLIYVFKLDKLILPDSQSYLVGVITIVFSYCLFIIGRFLYTTLIAWIFNFSKLVNVQNTEYSKLLEKIFILAVILIYGIMVSGLLKFDIDVRILYFSLVLILFLCLIRVIILFFRVISHRNLYLFSYICAAEIIPLIIAVKIILY